MSSDNQDVFAEESEDRVPKERDFKKLMAIYAIDGAQLSLKHTGERLSEVALALRKIQPGNVEESIDKVDENLEFHLKRLEFEVSLIRQAKEVLKKACKENLQKTQ